jgi:hypothetical protein
MFANATTTQSEQLRTAVRDATLAALRGRELSLQNIGEALKSVSAAATAGAAKNVGTGIDVPSLLQDAVSGMDDAMLKAVEANRLALQQFVDQGANLQETQLKTALGQLEQFENTLFSTLKSATAGTASPLAAQWSEVLNKFQLGGSASGSQAAATAQQLTEQMQTALRDSRAAGLQAAQAMTQSYTSLVSGVLIGMAEALKQGGTKR